VENVEEKQRMVGVTVDGGQDVVKIPKDSEKKQRVQRKPTEGVG
jgi:hypothetical protein